MVDTLSSHVVKMSIEVDVDSEDEMRQMRVVALFLTLEKQDKL